MAEKIRPVETNARTERGRSQFSRASGFASAEGTEQLLQLKRQQEQIEKQKRELEELSRRQEELEHGRAEMADKLTRSLVVLEREGYTRTKPARGKFAQPGRVSVSIWN